MKIICGTQKLRQAVEYTERIVARHLNLPILNNILIQVIGNGLKISSTNLEIGISSWFPCKIIKNGEITVPAKIFYGIISGLSTEKIDLEVKKDNTLSIISENYNAELKGENTKEFPIIPRLKNGLTFTVKCSDITKAINQVIGFVSNSETRPEITGVLLSKDKKDFFLRIVGTDSFRLGEKTIVLGEGFKDLEFSIIIPARTATEVVRVYGAQSSELKIVLEKNQAYFESEKIEVISRVIEGNYPDYRRLIPNEFNTKAVLNKDVFVKTLRLISLLAGRVNDVSLSFIKSGEVGVRIFASDPDLGENNSFLNADITGDGLTIKFNWRYLADGVGGVIADKIVLNFVDELKPCLIRSTQQDDRFLYLVMPIRV